MAMKYVGGGAFIQNVPARDLNDEEAARYKAAIVAQQRVSGLTLYVEIVPAPVAGRKGNKQPDEQPGEDN